ncbi:MAG: Gfo/Idh/MocA family oxidoreductase [Phycisphaerae bacterium]|nr:Gfo/Idh/MocA family oxidoreductase [Phycisphaerae bacterium]
MANKNLTRRDFLAGSLAATAFMYVPKHVLGGPGITAPSDKLNIAAIGAGGRAGSNIVGAGKGNNIVALCDVDLNRAKDMWGRYPNAAKFRDFRVMLDKQKDIDAVIVSTPDHMHAYAALSAIKMGKHVYCEKPLTHTIQEARILTEQARKYKVATQMGNQGHSGSGIRRVSEWVKSGVIGKIKEVRCWTDRPNNWWPQGMDKFPAEAQPVPSTLEWDMWLGTAAWREYNAAYLPFIWRGWWDFGTGSLGDMGCHIMDIPFTALGLKAPISVEADTGKFSAVSPPLESTIKYEFMVDGNKVPFTWYDGGRLPERPKMVPKDAKLGDGCGSMIIGEDAVIVAGTYGGGAWVYPEAKMDEIKKVPKSTPNSPGHYEEWIAACKGGAKAGSNFDVSGALTETVLLGNVAMLAKQKILWDSKNLKVTNSAEANKLISKTYRKGWDIKDLL